MQLLLTAAQCALILSTLVAATPTASKYVMHEERSAFMPKTYLQARSKLAGRHVLPIRIGLTQRALDIADDWLMDIAHPESPNYGQLWTAEQVNKAFAPTAETVTAVRDWLIGAGIHESRISVSDNKGWLAFDAAVEEAEQLFKAQFYEHGHDEEDKYTVGCDSYYLPEHIKDHIDYITPGVKHQIFKRELLEPSKKKRSLEKRLAPIPAPDSAEGLAMGFHIDAKTPKPINPNCSHTTVNADCVRSLYQLGPINVNKKVDPRNVLGVFEQQEQTYSQEDLNLFFTNLVPQIPVGTQPINTPVDGGPTIGPVNASGGEAMLDITIGYALIYPQQLSYIGVDDVYIQDNYYYKGFGDTLLDALDGSFCTYSAFGQKGNNDTIDPVYPDPHVGGYKGPLQCGTLTPPSVISFSYGPGEVAWPVNYEKRQCNEWLKLALQGTTGVFASGDNGVAGQINGVMRDRTCIGDQGQIFVPGYPASCPYVLTVGGTQIKTNTSGYTANSETAVFSGSATSGPNGNYTSGGGFSNVFPRPSYQDQAVKSYFQNSKHAAAIPYYKTTNAADIGKNGGVYNRIGRAVPDVSANGGFWQTYYGGRYHRVGGTSQSTPLFASIVNLINEARLAHGKSTVGFLHPTLYAHPEAFHDIVDGFNQGCGLPVAFDAIPGWDPVTGLGTPNFEKLKDIFLSLP